ncbi:MAG TPA: helix-turn-helix domain-containing protein [Kiritimatiellia bacterium]
MESLGQTFKSTRERKRVSLSQAAAKTRIKVQILEGLEKNDFSTIAAPTYAKGFIKMYAEYLGLDPAPLIKEYNERQPAKGKTDRASAVAAVPAPPQASAAPVVAGPEDTIPPDAGARSVLSGISWRLTASLVGSLLLVIILTATVSRCGSGDAEKPVKIAAASVPAPKRNPLAMIQEPAEPYMHVAGVSTNKP